MPHDGQDTSLTGRLAGTLRAAIAAGEFKTGDRLPSAAELTRQHGVSRTVVREAVAELRSEGLVESRKGAGIYVRRNALIPVSESRLATLPEVIDMLELRSAVEVEAAGLAARRGSPAQHAAIREALEAIRPEDSKDKGAAKLDLGFHKAIADATNNARFGRFLDTLGLDAVPRSRLLEPGDEPHAMRDYMDQLNAEHIAICEAISQCDAEGARAAMRDHLSGGLLRYQTLLNQIS